jgi:LysW-gamma-L-lysine carboxypeptidase
LIKLGVEPKLSRKWGTADFNILAALTKNIVAFGPGDPVYAHTEDERIEVAQVETAAAALKLAVGEIK